MDLDLATHTIQQQDNTPSSTTPSETSFIAPTLTTAITSPTPSTVARPNTRSKAAKEKETASEASGSNWKGKGRARPIVIQEESGRLLRKRKADNTAVTAHGLIIQEPRADLKGKKRAQADPDSSEEQPTNPTKRRKSAARNTRSTSQSNMPKNRRTSGKGKAAANAKGKGVASLEDVEMMDAGFGSDSEREMEMSPPVENEKMDHDEYNDEDDNGDDDAMGAEEAAAVVAAAEAAAEGAANGGAGGVGDEEARSLFGLLSGDFSQLGSFLSNVSSRLKQLLANIKQREDPTIRVIALQELSELLSVSNEDTLHGFSVDGFVTALVRIMGGNGKIVDGDGDDSDGDGSNDDEDEGEKDPDAALAAALAAGNEGAMEDIPEAQLLACRCLANLMEAIPGSAHTIVYHGAVPVLCSKLVMITDIDLAEQTLSTMEKISEEYPSSIVREGGLSALLNMLDFFPTSVQRIALQAAANCCRNLSSDSFEMARPIFPIVRSMLTSSDQRLVEYSALCVIRIIESYHRSAPDNLIKLLDADFIRAIGVVLLPASNSPVLSSGTYTQFLKALATAAKASALTALALLEADIVQILYQLLTGVLPSSEAGGGKEGQGDGGDAQGSGGAVAEMTVMDNLSHRPKEQVEEALSLVVELMPPLPKDGVFDAKGYTEKALAKLAKSRAKAEKTADRIATRALVQAPGTTACTTNLTTDGAATPELILPPAPTLEAAALPFEGTTPESMSAAGSRAASTTRVEQVSSRLELLQSKPEYTNRFIRLMVPVLVDVYAASVLTNVRVRSLSAILKAVNWLDGEVLETTLKNVPIASFAGSILASTDQYPLIIGTLQLVELLLMKHASAYRSSFRREGVLHSIDGIASRKLMTVKAKEREAKEKEAAATILAPLAPPITDADASGSTSTSTTVESTSVVEPIQVPTPAAPTKKASVPLDPQDVIILRATVVRFKYLTSQAEKEDDSLLQRLKSLAGTITERNLEESELIQAAANIAQTLSGGADDISSFELRQSGLVESLLAFVTEGGYVSGSVDRRRAILYDAFARTAEGLTVLVKRLQELLTRAENFEVRTVSPGLDDHKHRSASMLARSMRLKLAGEESSAIPKSVANMTVSIQAIATFQALNDYLRPRLSGGLPSLGSSAARLSAMLAMAESRASALFGTTSTTPRSTLAPPAPPPIAAPAASTSQPDSGTPAASGSASASAAQVTRRRSQRLSAKKSNETVTPAASVEPAGEPSSLLQDLGDDIDPDFDTEIVEDDADEEAQESTVNVAVTADGSKMEAKTPQGTRVATPNPLKDRPPPTPTPSGSSRNSYAAALKAKATDWHLQFSIDDHIIPMEATIFGAFYQHEVRKTGGGSIQPSTIWSGLYTVKFKKVDGPVPTPEPKQLVEDEGSKSLLQPASLPVDDLCAQTLRLLRVIHKLNGDAIHHSSTQVRKTALPPSVFVNNKLTAKLIRQLEETMIVASSCLPEWALDLPQHYPLLFPFATRYSFLQSTSFGYARLILKWQSQQERPSESSRRDDGFGYLGRLQRQKVRISRQHVLESAIKVFELYGSSSSVLEVEYFEEVGTGLGPTLEFYSLISKEFARRDLKLWHDTDSTVKGPYVHHPHGLFPAPILATDLSEAAHAKKVQLFQVMGQFVAKALLDSRIIDISFNQIFLKLVLADDVAATIDTLRLVDPTLAASLTKVLSCKASEEPASSVEALSLDFTIPGYDLELRPDGANISVTSENVHEYVQETLDAMLGKGVRAQVQAFRQGFSKVFLISDMRMFTVDELSMLFGNGEEDWSVEALNEAIKADHGFTMDSAPIRDLIAIMSEFDTLSRRQFLQFITGSPKLPIGGFKGLNPTFTVVRKPHEAPLTADDYLPSVMTCVNYLKLPEYSSKFSMKAKMGLAVKEGIHSGFHLS